MCVCFVLAVRAHELMTLLGLLPKRSKAWAAPAGQAKKISLHTRTFCEGMCGIAAHFFALKENS